MQVQAGKYLVAIGGSSIDTGHLSSVELLDLEELEEWTEGPSMNRERRYSIQHECCPGCD